MKHNYGMVAQSCTRHLREYHFEISITILMNCSLLGPATLAVVLQISHSHCVCASASGAWVYGRNPNNIHLISPVCVLVSQPIDFCKTQKISSFLSYPRAWLCSLDITLSTSCDCTRTTKHMTSRFVHTCRTL